MKTAAVFVLACLCALALMALLAVIGPGVQYTPTDSPTPALEGTPQVGCTTRPCEIPTPQA